MSKEHLVDILEAYKEALVDTLNYEDKPPVASRYIYKMWCFVGAMQSIVDDYVGGEEGDE